MWKRAVKTSIRRLGFDIVRYVPELEAPFDPMPYLVRELVESDAFGYFAQVGANDGVLDDDLRPLVVRHRLPGVLIEPIPDVFERLKANYSDQDQVRFVREAVADREGTVTIHRAIQESGIYAQGLASMNREHLIREGIPSENIRAEEVPARRLSSIIREYGVADVSLLVVDTEGFDDVVVSGALDDGVRPTILRFEHCHLEPVRRNRLLQKLIDSGYSFLAVGKDYVARMDTDSDSN